MKKMNHISFIRRHSIADNRKVPLNTIILPPLTPPPPENGTDIFGKIVVNKSISGTVSSEVVTSKPQEVPRSDDFSSKTPEQVRLEQNIKFLQETHQLMLTGLYGEIEKLKAKNRELQFHLIFGKAPISSSSPSPSSPEEDVKHQLYTSPKVVTNTTPLQVELLEKELGELKIQVQEQESRNLYLTAIVEEQKKQLERYDRRREKEQQRTNGPGDAEMELMRKLEDAETLIRRLRRENSDLRKENQSINEATVHGSHGQQNHHRDNNGYQSPRGHGHRGGNGRGHRSGNGQNGQYNSRVGWFPPLHSQSYWQGGRSQHDRSHNPSQDHGPNLPDIPLNDAGSSSHHRQPQLYQGNCRKGSNNNHYHNGDGRKYRGHNKGNKPS